MNTIRLVSFSTGFSSSKHILIDFPTSRAAIMPSPIKPWRSYLLDSHGVSRVRPYPVRLDPRIISKLGPSPADPI
jgi:hypothetical protein